VDDFKALDVDPVEEEMGEHHPKLDEDSAEPTTSLVERTA